MEDANCSLRHYHIYPPLSALKKTPSLLGAALKQCVNKQTPVLSFPRVCKHVPADL